MRKLRDRLNNKKGFTLVELIVVIVIILILAAVLVPNVMRYIGEARKSTCQQEASSYLTEIQGYAAECFAKNNVDVKTDDFKASGATAAKYKITSGKDGAPTVTITTTSATGKVTTSSDKKTINAYVKDGVVESFGYINSAGYYVNWTQTGGWTDVEKAS